MWKSAALVVVAAQMATCHAADLGPADQVVDPVIDAVLASLASRWGYNLLSAPDEGAASIGNLYYVTSPACSVELTRMADDGRAVKVFQALAISEPLPTPPIRNEWVSVRLSSVLAKGAKANLYARLPDRKVELDAAFEALRATNAQILVGSRSIGSFDVKRAATRQFKKSGIVKIDDLGGNDAVGALAPHAELLLQKFEFDIELGKAARSSIWVSFLELFGARLSAESSVRAVQGFRLPTYSTLAFKPVAMLFDNSKCPQPK